MVYDLIKKFAFIHAPRSAGTNIQLTLLPYLTQASVADLLARRHWTALQVQELVGPVVWDSLFSFGVLRDINEIKESWYRHVCASRHIYLYDKNALDPEWNSYLEATWDLKDVEEVWQLAELPKTTEAWFAHFFCDSDGKQIVTEVVDFKELKDKWEVICKKCAVDPAPKLIH